MGKDNNMPPAESKESYQQTTPKCCRNTWKEVHYSENLQEGIDDKGWGNDPCDHPMMIGLPLQLFFVRIQYPSNTKSTFVPR